jgi:hypothetical protein
MSKSVEGSSAGMIAAAFGCDKVFVASLVESPSDSSSEDSAGVRIGGLDFCRVCENKMVCFVVGEVRKGNVRDFYK